MFGHYNNWGLPLRVNDFPGFENLKSPGMPENT
jgi:hypothetical protein